MTYNVIGGTLSLNQSATARIHLPCAHATTLWPARQRPARGSPEWLKWTWRHCSCSHALI